MFSWNVNKCVLIKTNTGLGTQKILTNMILLLELHLADVWVLLVDPLVALPLKKK